MKVCFPVAEDLGVHSEVFRHFGSAPAFLVVDLATRAVISITPDGMPGQSAGNPFPRFGEQEFDAIVVGGIGGEALFRLRRAGIRIFQAQNVTVAHNLILFQHDLLVEYLPGQACSGRPGSECSH